MDTRDRAPELERSNRELVVQLALDVLASQGRIDAADDELIAALARLYDAHPICQRRVEFTGELLHDLLAARPGEYLAAAWEQEQQQRWERECAERWSCPCGHTFGLYPTYGERVTFYTLADDGLFDERVNECPNCQRDLAKTRSDVPTGQLGFGF